VRLAGGNVRCWGLNDAGQLGLGHVQSIGDDEPAAKAGDVDVGGAVVQLVAGDNHTCALLETGNVRCWGLGEYGALGYGNNEDVGNDEVPSSAGDVDVGGKVRMLAAGFAHTCALLETGHVRCWGCADFGQLGYGNTNMVGDDETPASAGDVDVGGEVVQVVAGGDETCALLTGGRVRCWGWNQEGELGYGNVAQIGDDETPASAGDVDVGGVVVQLDAGFSHTCALLATGNVRCWGWNQDGQLGYGNKNTIGDDESPASAGDVEVGGAVVRLTAGGVHTCALLEGGKVRCWGWADLGQLGLASTDSIGDDEMPASAGHVPVGGNVVQVAAGGNHTCALLETGTLRCWGAGESGQLGYGNKNTIGDDETPASVGDVPFE
jgi:alpha-tubulin suppressor-like RCC1 family protein